ncbi:tail completion protein gp17 [Sphingomonas beigongshangi]|uniref:tail completion protein gp17 n=1 Tax=Sphingomonas beigongshangi TaxID=2782540 RepID=UPI001AEEBB5C|nr:hypothetical protein [Sphingomonas beigongshangi]
MTGTDIVAARLITHADLKAIADRGALKEDRLPDGVSLPVILLRTISSVDRQPLKLGELRRSTDRVAVLVRAGSVKERKALIGLIRSVAPGEDEALADCFAVSTRLAGLGPSLLGPGDTYEQTQDLRVTYDAPA